MKNDIEAWGARNDWACGTQKAIEVRPPAAVASSPFCWGSGSGPSALGARAWSSDLAFLRALDSAPARVASALCVTSGVLGPWLSRAAFWNSL